MAKRISSRLAKKEQQKMTRQAIMFIVMAVIVIALFIFLVMPAVIRLFFGLIDSDNPFKEEDIIPPQPPAVHSLPSATSSAQLAIGGFGEPSSLVTVVVNSDKQEQVEVSEEGQFETEVMLAEGQNQVGLYAEDEAGNESILRNFQVISDTQAPEIEVESPEDGAQIELEKNQVITIKGKTEPSSKVYVNDRLTLATSEGSFTHRYRLEEGENKLEIRAVDQAGNETKTELTVRYRD